MKASKREKMKVAKIFDGKEASTREGQDDWKPQAGLSGVKLVNGERS
jgi:hypothetical protein